MFDGPNVDPGDLIVADNAYGTDDKAVWAINPLTGVARAIAKGSVFVDGPVSVAFSPEGRLFVYQNYDSGSSRIVILDADGTVTPFLSDIPDRGGSAINPVTGEIYFGLQEDVREIWRIPCAGGTPEVFASGFTARFQDMRFSPDGRSLFVSASNDVIEIAGPFAYAQGLSIEEIKTNLLNNPPNSGDPTVRKEAILGLDEILKDDACRSSSDVLDFYSSMMEKVNNELQEEVSVGAAVWMMYNHGFVVKTPEVVFAFDLVSGYVGWPGQPIGWPEEKLPEELIKKIDVLFVSHQHGDHYDPRVINIVMDNGGYVVTPSEALTNGEGFMMGNVKMVAGDTQTISGLHVKAHYGLHSVPVRIFEVTCPSSLKFLHTGDNQTSETLPEVDGLDVLLLNAWVNESGATSSVVGMHNSIDKLKPRVMIPGHIHEL